MKLLTRGNPKTSKGLKHGYLTSILHLAPADMSGFNVCPLASDGCKAACLNTAGRGGMFAGVSTKNSTGEELRQDILTGALRNVIQHARIIKTRWLMNPLTRLSFLKQLIQEVEVALRYAEKRNLAPCFRLNGTSDIQWENVKIGGAPNIMTLFPEAIWYDYTKITKRLFSKTLPKNYDLTFSLSENNDTDARAVLAVGKNVAAVFQMPMPSQFMGVDVVNGDETDLRFLDRKGVIVGLKAKGKAKKDTTGFVRL